jgi:hypothetical protein
LYLLASLEALGAEVVRAKPTADGVEENFICGQSFTVTMENQRLMPKAYEDKDLVLLYSLAS